MKKLIALILCLCVAAAVLAGCGTDANNTNTNTNTNTNLNTNTNTGYMTLNEAFSSVASNQTIKTLLNVTETSNASLVFISSMYLLW